MNTIAKVYPLVNQSLWYSDSIPYPRFNSKSAKIHINLHAKNNAVLDILCMWFLKRVLSAALVNKFEWCRAEHLFLQSKLRHIQK